MDGCPSRLAGAGIGRDMGFWSITFWTINNDLLDMDGSLLKGLCCVTVSYANLKRKADAQRKV